MKIGQNLVVSVAAISLLISCSDVGGDEGTGAGSGAGSAEAPYDFPGPNEVHTIDGTELSDFTGNVARGQEIFVQCSACHVIEPGINRIGPSLAGIPGRAAGTSRRFNYTAEVSGSRIFWSPEKLNQYLENPQRVIPGSRETFAGLSDGQDRADVIAFLQENAGS